MADWRSQLADVDQAAQPLLWQPYVVIAVLFIAALLALLWLKFHKRRVHLDAIGLIKQQLQAIDPQDPQSIALIHHQLKLAALQFRPRQEVAALHGEAWLDWLDGQLSSPLFHHERETLLQALYQPCEDNLFAERQRNNALVWLGTWKPE